MRQSSLVFALPLTALLLSACATSPDKMMAADVSPLQYKSLDCEQVAIEQNRISRKTSELYESLKTKASNDQWQMGVGMLLFWPVLFALEGGDGPEAAEYKNLKGQYAALEQISLQKKCGIAFAPLDAQVKAKAATDAKKAPAASTTPR